jgi:hypothetical protein
VEGFEDTVSKVDKMVNRLRERDLVGIFCIPGDSPVAVLLVYPTRSVNFDFLNGDDDVPETASLRVAIRGRLLPFEILPSVPPRELTEESHSHRAPTPGKLKSRDCVVDSLGLSKELATLTCADRAENTTVKPLSKVDNTLPKTPEMDANMVDSSTAEGPKHDVNIDVFFKDNFGITFAELATVNSPKNGGPAKACYLKFPTEAQTEFELLSEFLRKHEVVIFSSRLPEDWERFAKMVVNGIVLVCYDHKWRRPQVVGCANRNSFTIASFITTKCHVSWT